MGEVSATVAEENGDRAATGVRGHEVGAGVAVDIGGGDGPVRIGSDVDRRARTAPAVASEEQHDAVLAPAIDGEVRFAVAIEVADGYGVRVRLWGEVASGGGR